MTLAGLLRSLAIVDWPFDPLLLVWAIGEASPSKDPTKLTWLRERLCPRRASCVPMRACICSAPYFSERGPEMDALIASMSAAGASFLEPMVKVRLKDIGDD